MQWCTPNQAQIKGLAYLLFSLAQPLIYRDNKFTLFLLFPSWGHLPRLGNERATAVSHRQASLLFSMFSYTTVICKLINKLFLFCVLL